MPSVQWPAWGTAARVAVTDPAAIHAAHRLVAARVAAGEKVADPAQRGSEIHRAERAGGRPVRISPLLTAIVLASLDVARLTGGLADPTVGALTAQLRAQRRHHGKDLSLLPVCASFPQQSPRPALGWRAIQLEERRLSVPRGAALDLTSTATAVTAEHCAAEVTRHLGVGALVSIGDTVATTGRTPFGGWYSDLPAGFASSTVNSTDLVLDPRTGRPAPSTWASVTVIAHRCRVAAGVALAATILGESAPQWLNTLSTSTAPELRGLGARLTTADGATFLIGTLAAGSDRSETPEPVSAAYTQLARPALAR